MTSAKNIKEIKHQGKTWIDITRPTKKQLATLQQKFKLHEADIKAASDKIAIPKTFEHRSYLFIAMHSGEIVNHRIKYHEVDVFVSRRFILTVHYEQLDFIDEIFADIAETDSANPVNILYEILKKVTFTSQEITDSIAAAVKNLEDELITDQSDQTVKQILYIRRDLIELSSVAQPNLNVIKEITQSHLLMNSFSNHIVYFDSLVEMQEKNFTLIKHYHELIDGITDTANILANYRFNDVIRVLTIASVSLMPPALIAGLLGMNFRSFLFEVPFGFFITLLFIIILEILIIQYFKYKKWL